MADFNSSYTGTQIESAIAAVNTAINAGGIVPSNTLNNNYYTITNTNNAITTALDARYPVGSVQIMTSNTNPGSFLPGTWTLYDKQFKDQWIDSFTPTLNTTNCTTAAVEGRVAGHCIYLTFTMTNKVAITDTALVMFTIDPTLFGVDAFYSQNFAHFSDTGNAIIMGNLTGAGVYSTLDVIVRGSSSASLSSGAREKFTLTMLSSYTHMLDSWCDKFYFKRTE